MPLMSRREPPLLVKTPGPESEWPAILQHSHAAHLKRLEPPLAFCFAAVLDQVLRVEARIGGSMPELHWLGDQDAKRAKSAFEHYDDNEGHYVTLPSREREHDTHGHHRASF